MIKSKWEKMGRIGYGDNYRQEYSLDEKGYIYCYTSNKDPRFPTDIKYDANTIDHIKTYMDGFGLYKFKLLEKDVPKLNEKEKLAKEWGF